MTRSDLIFAVHQLDTMSDKDKNQLIHGMHKKIEGAYKVVFALEDNAEDDKFVPLGNCLRKALEA